MSKRVAVELVHLDDCPHWRQAATRLGDAMRIAGQDPTSVRCRSVATAHAPANFAGSPTILIDGRDPFPNGVHAGPTCRRYPTEHGLDFAPSLDQLVEMLIRRPHAPDTRGSGR
ncbi:MAG: thioredoxin family protein [Acidimicrobiia bacterium]